MPLLFLSLPRRGKSSELSTIILFNQEKYTSAHYGSGAALNSMDTIAGKTLKSLPLWLMFW